MVFHADENTEIGLCQGVSLMNEGWILQVEDDENDVILLRHAFVEAGVYNHVHVVPTGQQAIDYLAGLGIYADREKFPMPRLVLLDVKLPGISGLEVLQWIRRQRALDWLTVVVFSSSPAIADIKTAYKIGANSYIVKPSGTADRVRVAEEIRMWFQKGTREPQPGGVWRSPGGDRDERQREGHGPKKG
jgi:CheY-like chemotaxis protein